jgi:NAD(P)-dependent dehydrogenase (short-subunit alcohol dehydrogenase family)
MDDPIDGGAPAVASGNADLSDGVAVVTGAGTHLSGPGIGAACARLLAAGGAKVAIIDRDAEAAGRTLAAIEAEDGTAAVFLGDVNDHEACREMIAAVEGELGLPSILVNNVGILGAPGTVVDVDLDAWDETMTVNVRTMVTMSRHCVPRMSARGGGSIVNLSSTAGLLGGYPTVAYGTSKGAIAQLTRLMAQHHGDEGIRVNAVAPGMVWTPMIADKISPEMRDIRRRSSLLKTEGNAWDVAAAVAYLAGPAARWITGVVLAVDAGMSAAMALAPVEPLS